MAKSALKLMRRLRRHRHIRKTLQGNAETPRLVVFRSAKHIYAQIIDDACGKTLVSASSLADKVDSGGNKDGAVKVGTLLAEKAKAVNIESVVFDRNGFKYHGRIAALADAARESGLKF